MFLRVGGSVQTSRHRQVRVARSSLKPLSDRKLPEQIGARAVQACGISSTFLGSSAQQAVPLVYGKRVFAAASRRDPRAAVSRLASCKDALLCSERALASRRLRPCER